MSVRTLLTLILLVLGMHLFVLVEVAEAAKIQATKPMRREYATSTKTIQTDHMRVLKDSFAKVAQKPLVDGYSRYSSDAMGLSLEYPKGWKAELLNTLEMIPGSLGDQPDAGHYVVAFSAPDDVDGKTRYVVFRIEMTLHPKDVTIDDLDTDFLKLYNFDVRTNKVGTYTYYVPNMSPVTHSQASVGPYMGKRYVFTSEKSSLKYAMTQVSIPVGKRLYQFQMLTNPKYAKDANPAFERLLQTVTFREPTFTKSITEKAKSSKSAYPTLKKR